MKAEILLKHSYRRKAVKDSESLLTCSDLQTERYINMTNSGESSSENCVSSNGNESDEDADGSSFPSSASDVDKEPCSNRTSETKYICDETDETIEAEKLRSADLDNSPLHKHSFEDHGTIMTPSYLSLNINGQAIGSVSTDQAEHSMDGQTATLRKSPGTHSRAHSSEVLPLNMVKTPTKATTASFSGASCISYTSIDSPAGSPEHLRPHLMATISPSVLNLSTSALLDGVPVSPLMSPPVSLSHPCLDLAADDVSVLQANPGNPSYLRLFSADGESLLPSTEVYGCKWMQCDRKFSSMDALVYHVNDQHVKVERPDVDYQCKWNGCPRKGRGFNARYKMLIHIRTHTNEKPHKCASCGKCFSRLENLKIHNRSHTGERPYVCPFEGCGKAYSNSSDRFKHVRTHSEEKPYICKMQGCNKRYTDPSSLRKHVRTHGHYYRENEKHSVSKTSCNVSSANSVIENSRALNLCPMTQVLLPVTTGPVLKSQNLITPPSLLSGSSIPRMMTVSPSFQKVVSGPSYTSNPLLSSTILVTPQIKSHPDGITTPHSSPIKLELGPEAGSHDQEKCQDGPLDLSTSTQSDQDTDLVVEEHDSAGFSSTKWDLLH